MVKFIRYKNTTYNVILIHSMFYDENRKEIIIKFFNEDLWVIPTLGFVHCSLECFLETIEKEGYEWRSCFVIENFLEQEKEIHSEHEKAKEYALKNL